MHGVLLGMHGVLWGVHGVLWGALGVLCGVCMVCRMSWGTGVHGVLCVVYSRYTQEDGICQIRTQSSAAPDTAQSYLLHRKHQCKIGIHQQ